MLCWGRGNDSEKMASGCKLLMNLSLIGAGTGGGDERNRNLGHQKAGEEKRVG